MYGIVSPPPKPSSIVKILHKNTLFTLSAKGGNPTKEEVTAKILAIPVARHPSLDTDH